VIFYTERRFITEVFYTLPVLFISINHHSLRSTLGSVQNVFFLSFTKVWLLQAVEGLRNNKKRLPIHTGMFSSPPGHSTHESDTEIKQ